MQRICLAALCCLGLTTTAFGQEVLIIEVELEYEYSYSVRSSRHLVVEEATHSHRCTCSGCRHSAYDQHTEALIADLNRRDAENKRRWRYADAANARRDSELRDLDRRVDATNERIDMLQKELDCKLAALWKEVKSHKHSCSCDPCRRHEHLNYSWHTHYGYNWYPGWGYAHTQLAGWR